MSDSTNLPGVSGERLSDCSPLVVSLCDRTGNMLRPWAEAGHPCIAVDIQHRAGQGDLQQFPSGGYISFEHGDLLDWMPPRRPIGMLFAFPPCTHLAQSGARWFRDKGLAKLIEGLTLVENCRKWAEWSGAPWMIENPVGQLSTYWRKPDYLFDPYEFAGYQLLSPDTYTKRTCLWVGNGFRIPTRRPMEPVDGSKMHLMGPSEDRADLRSETPMGFAIAVYEANRERLEVAA